MSFFGGDPNKAHFVVGLRYRINANETLKEAKPRVAEERAKLKAAGVKPQQYFQFLVKDEAGKAKAKKKAEAEAQRIKKLTGVTMEVAEGFFW